MLYFIIGFLCAWLLLGVFVYVRENKGGITLWDNAWDCWVLLGPAIPFILLVEIIIERRK